MKVAYLATGAAGMYCGSCMRDNRIAATLIEQGRDVVLLPMYTPLRTDEKDVSEDRVLFGGINVYLQQKAALFRHTPAFVDRLLDSPALLNGVGRLASKTRAQDVGDLTVSILKGEDGFQRKELNKLLEVLKTLRPNLVNLPNLMMTGLAPRIREELQVPIVCTLPGEDVFLDALPEPYQSRSLCLIREHATSIDAFLSVSQYYAARSIARFHLPKDRVHVVGLGIRTEDFSKAVPPTEGPISIGYFARICPDKGLHLLARAFAILRESEHSCRLKIAGYLGAADKPYLDQLIGELHAAGLRGLVDYEGELSRGQKIAFLQSLHILSVPTTYPEAKGTYLLEAMACGVPVVQPRHGVCTEIIEATNGGLLVEPLNAQALAAGLQTLITDANLRNRLGNSAFAAVHEKYSAELAAERTWDVYEQVCGTGPLKGQHTPRTMTSE